jgi:hypothetical protein
MAKAKTTISEKRNDNESGTLCTVHGVGWEANASGMESERGRWVRGSDTTIQGLNTNQDSRRTIQVVNCPKTEIIIDSAS